MVDYPNIFAQGQAAFKTAYDQTKGIAQDYASRQAGAAIADGDYAGGANIFNRQGMVGEAQDVQARQLALQDRQTAATNTAEDRATKTKALAADNFGKALAAIQDVPEGQRLPWIQQHAADLQTLGIPTDKFQGKTEADVSNASIAPLWKALGKTKEDYSMGGVRYDGTTNKPKAGFVEFDPHKAIYAVGDGPDAGPPAGPAPAPAPTAPPAIDPTAAPAASVRGVRNNNPVNLTTLPHGQWAGQSGADGRFAVFSSPEAGIAAADKNLVSYATNHGINTISGIINRWAPAGDGTNDPKAYAATVAKEIGVDPNQPINLADPKVRAVILHSMSKVELGGSGAQVASAAPGTLQGGAGADTIPPPPAPPHIGGFHAVSQARPEWQDMGDGRQRNVITGKVEGTADEKWKSDGHGVLINANGDRKIDPTVAGAGGTPTGNTALAGEEYLKTMPAARSAQVKAMLDGRLGYPGAMALKTPYWQSMIADAAQTDPEFDATKFAARAKMRTSAATPTASGLGGQLASINTAIGHLGSLQAAIAPLDNSRFDLINPAIIGFKQHFGSPAQQKAVKDYETAALTVSTEIPKALRGAGVAESDIKAWQKIFKVNDAPASQQSAVAKAVDLLDSRLEPLQTLWSTTMGSSAGPLTVIYPKAAQTLARLKAGGDSTPPAPAAAPSGWGPAQVVRH